MANPCAVCGEEMAPVYACLKPHESAGALVGSAMHVCPAQKGAIWVHVVHDGDGNNNVPGVSVKNSVGGDKDTDGSGFSPYDPLDERSDYTVSLNPLSTELAKMYRLPAEVTVPNVPVRKGQITSVQLKLERVAPLKVIVKRSDVDEFVKDIPVEVTTTVPRNAPETAGQTTPDGGTVEYPKLAKGSYKVALKLSDEDKARWRVDGSDSQDWTLDPTPGATNEVTFKLTPIIRIYLKLQFKDPEDFLRNFPKNFKFNLDFEAGPEPRKREVVVNDDGIATADGKAYVEVERAAKSFKIDLKQAGVAWVACEKRGAAKTQELVQGTDPLWGVALTKLKAEARIFRLPVADWTLLNSRWSIDRDPIKGGATHTDDDAKFGGIDALPAEVGSEATPVLLTLKPAWQFMRFTYYDRKLKGDDPLSVPSKPNGEVMPIIVDGWRDKADETADKPADARSMWPLVDDDTKNVMCVPWIIGKGGDKADDKVKPDGETILRFKRKEAKPFIHTTDATDRKLIDFSDADLRDKPSAARLAYYDLPKVWKSRGYFGWLSDADGDWGPYEDIATKDTALDKPLVFSLDDMVLTKEDLAPVVAPWDKTTRVALLAHTFNTSGAAPGAIGPAADPPTDKPQKPTPKGRRWLNYLGLYNPDDTADEHRSYLSKVKMEVNYLADYPHWTRLVAMKGNLFDVFDQRTPDHASNVVGARAAVRWVDAVTGKPAGGTVARAARTDKNFFHFQPHVETQYAQRFAKVPYSHNSPSTCSLGRFDYALLRCCDIDGSNEKAVNLVYFRMHFAFPAAAASVVSAYTTAGTAMPDLSSPKDKKYAEDFVVNVGRRWNGDDGTAPAARFKFLSRDTPAAPLEIDHVWFGQSLEAAQSHFTCNVVITDPADGARSWFDGTNGNGELSPTGCGDEDSDGGGLMWFVGAHECGHGVGLNDDYCERWDAQSYGQLSFRWHLPGDPFEPDGRTVQFHEAGAAMMNGNQQMRNRYVWHCAEWVRQATTKKLKVKLGTYDDYWLPQHATAARNFAFWPIAAANDHEPDATNTRGKYSLLLYALGKEQYSQTGLAGAVGASGAFDGILVVTINFALTMHNWGSHNENNRSRILQDMATIIRDSTNGMNGRFVAAGSVNNGTDQAWTFSRCLIHFSPRLCVKNHHSEATAGATLASTMGTQFTIDIAENTALTAGHAHWNPTTAETADIDKLADWKSGTQGTTARTPPDADLDAMDTLISDYHALDEAKLIARRDKLRAIKNAATAWLAQGGEMGGLFDEPVPGWNARNSAVMAMEAAAEARANYLDGLKTQRTVKISGKSWAHWPAKFAQHYPSFLGLFKPPADVVAADLQTLVRQVIPGGTVSNV